MKSKVPNHKRNPQTLKYGVSGFEENPIDNSGVHGLGRASLLMLWHKSTGKMESKVIQNSTSNVKKN